MLSLWIGKYKFGELTQDNINEITIMTKGKGTIVFSLPNNLKDPVG